MDFSFSFIFAEQSNTIDGCGACTPVAIVVDLQPNIVLCESCPGLFSLAQLFFFSRRRNSCTSLLEHRIEIKKKYR